MASFVAVLAVLRREDFEVAEQLKPRLEHIEVVLIVFSQEHFDHGGHPFDGRSETPSLDHLIGDGGCNASRFQTRTVGGGALLRWSAVQSAGSHKSHQGPCLSHYQMCLACLPARSSPAALPLKPYHYPTAGIQRT